LPPWQHPKTVTRKEAEKLFKQPENSVQGAFLVRESAKRQGEFALSVFLSSKPQHFVIKCKPGPLYSIDDGPKYPTLSGLVDYYMNDPSSPTRITKPVCRPGSTAPQLMPRATGGRNPSAPRVITDNAYENVRETLKAAAPAAAAEAPPEPDSEPDDGAGDDLPAMPMQHKKADVKNTKVKKILDDQDAVNAMDVAGRDVTMADGANHANYLAVQFDKEATMTEKLHLFWINKKLETMKSKTRISNVTEDLADAVIVIQLVAELSGKKPPRYNKKPKNEIFIRDNWSNVVSFMKSLGIQVDAEGKKEDAESVHLDARLLAEMDRREHLKMFSKLMLFENGLPC